MVFSSVAARFFLPQLSGAGATPSAPGGVFRIDHDEKFNQTTHVQYQFKKDGPWIGVNWRYDSGLVAGAVPFAADPTTPVDLSILSADQQMQAGLHCGNLFPTLYAPLTRFQIVSALGSMIWRMLAFTVGSLVWSERSFAPFCL